MITSKAPCVVSDYVLKKCPIVYFCVTRLIEMTDNETKRVSCSREKEKKMSMKWSEITQSEVAEIAI